VLEAEVQPAVSDPPFHHHLLDLGDGLGRPETNGEAVWFQDNEKIRR
jgi:hypothetical protein